MKQPNDFTLAKIEQAIVAIETQMTLRVTQIELLGAELSAAKAISGGVESLACGMG